MMPIKPYDSYQDTDTEWLKEIPSDWSISKVKHCFIRKNEKANLEDPVVLSLARDGVKIRDISTGEGQIAESYYHYNPVKPGDLLLNPMDLVSGANCSLSEVEGVISPAYVNLKAKKGINPKYYDYFFKLQYWSMALFAHGKGVSFENRWTINNETLMNYIIPLPDENTQNSIVNFLDKKLNKINNIIEKDQEFIELLEEKKVALINKVVTKGLDPNAHMKDSGFDWIGEIPEHWEIRKFNHLINFITKGSTPTTYGFEFVDEGINFIKVESISKNGNFIKSMFNYISEECNEFLSRSKFKEGDLLFSIAGALGRVAIVDKSILPANTNQALAIIRVKENLVLAEYLFFVFKSIYLINQITENTVQSAQANISMDSIKDFKILMPNIKEQNQIAIYLNNTTARIDKTITKIQQNIELLEEYKVSLIYNVVTGKIDVRDEV